MTKNETLCLNLFLGARKPDTSLRSLRYSVDILLEQYVYLQIVAEKGRLLHNSFKINQKT